MSVAIVMKSDACFSHSTFIFSVGPFHFMKITTINLNKKKKKCVSHLMIFFFLIS